MINQKRCKKCDAVYDFEKCPYCNKRKEIKKIDIRSVDWK